MAHGALSDTFDLVIIGGGITGAGIARDAALRGFSCALFEQGDFSSGTSSRTTRLIHGGLRYLERGHFHLVSESLREREILLHMAPHLVRPIPILLPVYKGDPRKRWKVRAGLALYDLLSMGKSTAHGRVLEPRAALRKVPLLSPTDLVAAGLFYDYQIPLPERLVLENILSARDHGAVCRNHHQVTGVAERMERFEVEVRNTLSGEQSTVCARLVVNATGPWADRVCALYRPDMAPKVLPTKGAHLVLPAALDHAVFSSTSRDQRLFFALPMGELTLVGTTDTAWQGDPGQARTSTEDIDYLLDGLRHLLPGHPYHPDDVLWTYSGVRPLAVRRAGGKLSDLSRDHVLHREGSGGRFLTIVGGKYTTFRKMAEDTVDAVATALGRPVCGTTDREPLFGGGMKDHVIFREHLCECTERLPNLPRQTVEHLLGLYGRRCCQVIDLAVERPALNQPIAPGYRDYRAQVAYAIHHEDARTLADMMLRRLHLSISADRGLAAAPHVAQLMAEELGWDETTRREQLCGLEHALELHPAKPAAPHPRQAL